jgi:hypothetical protein
MEASLSQGNSNFRKYDQTRGNISSEYFVNSIAFKDTEDEDGKITAISEGFTLKLGGTS